MTSTLAAQLIEAGHIEPVRFDIDEPGDGEVVVRVSAVGLCGSDAHWYEHAGIGDATLSRPLVLGHEFCGVIESGERAGQRVAVDPSIPCLTCVQCETGRHNLCSRLVFAGHGHTHGALRERLTWPERCLVPIPDDMPDEVAAMLEPLGVALHAIDLAALRDREYIGVVGCGPIGVLLAIAAQARGRTHIAASEPLPHRAEAAANLGLDVGAHPSASLDVVFETSGTDAGLATAMEWVRPAGRVVVVGIPDRDVTSLPASVGRRKELELRWCRRMRLGDLSRAAEVAARDPGSIGGLVSHRFSLSEAVEAFETLVRRQGMKVIVFPNPDPGTRDG